ncbi:hypothetical protein TrLO_g8885 [Triparma laevis f. longispina]|uniref:Uncharacterized protein n=1 Tax=Triparma laevis f. longispina TaxID=1714387 RepID=A0A9W7C541_9STRA|nr:hypothetical protein TrLO_g8885 [Triparma laevis f. longispina]
MFMKDFKRLLVDLVMGDTLMTLRFTTKAWKRVVDAFIDDGVSSGAMIVRGSSNLAWPLNERHKLVMRVAFLLNITKVGENACMLAFKLVVVDIPDGIKEIGDSAFSSCTSLTTVSFPTTLTLIGTWAFENCSSLENVDLLHTNLQELGGQSFRRVRSKGYVDAEEKEEN